MSKKKPCLNTLLVKLNGVDEKMCNLTEKLRSIKEFINKHNQAEQEEEVCPDVAESEKALVDAIESLYVEDLLTREPEGDA